MSTLYPQNNASRMTLDLGGIWDFRFQGDEGWKPIAVPASYNDLSPDPAFRKHCGLAWYRTRITLPSFFEGQRVVLRFDAVTHSCRVFLNGEQICSHRGGFLPFETELTGLLAPGETAELTVEVDNRINHDTLPIGVTRGSPRSKPASACRRRRGSTGPPSTSSITPASTARCGSIRRRRSISGT